MGSEGPQLRQRRRSQRADRAGVPQGLRSLTPSALETLRSTPAVLRALLGGVSPERATRNYGPGTFSPFDVVGHLIHGERTDWMPRLRTILEHGESRPFEPFDRFAMFEASRGQTLGALLDEFASLRRGNLDELSALRIPAERTGLHPELGRVTAGQLMATWAAHDLGHIAQVCRGLAAEFRGAVGPWSAYLSIVRPE